MFEETTSDMGNKRMSLESHGGGSTISGTNLPESQGKNPKMKAERGARR